MTFLNPFVLFALLAAGIPLIIHLINLRKPRRVDFSSLAFLKELRQQTIRRLRIKQWLLLALRTLAIVFLVLAFARPTVKSSSVANLSNDNRSVVVVLDNSLSMDLRDVGGSFLSQALEFTAVLAADMGTSDELAIIPLIDDGRRHPLGRPALAAVQLADITSMYGRGSLLPRLDNAVDALTEASNPAQTVYVVSDFQSTIFTDSIGTDLSRVAGTVLVPIGSQRVDNAAITGANVASSIVEVNQPVTIDIEVESFGSNAIENWGLSVYLADERVAQTNVSLGAGQSGVASVTVTPRSRGWLKGRISMEEDRFAYDNERFFTLHVPEQRKVLVVHGTARNTEALDLALSTQLNDDSTVFQLDTTDEGELSGTFSGQYDAVVLVGVRRLTSGTAAALAAFIQNGGGVLIFAGEEAAEGVYDRTLNLIGGGSFDGLAAAAPGVALATLDRLDREHPLFRSVFADDGTDDQSLERPSFSKIIRYRPGEGDEQTVMSTTVGLPMLQEIRYGSGRALIAPFVPEPAWTDLPVRGLFVPLLIRSMYYLTSADGASGEGIQSGTNTSFKVSHQDNGVRLRIVSDSGQEWIPEQRASAQGLYVTLPPTLRTPGIYDVFGGEELLQRFAVNMDPLESNLGRLDIPDAVARMETLGAAGVSVLEMDPTGVPTGESIRVQETGVEIWNVLLSFALVFLVAEMLVAARWKPSGISPVST